MAEWRDFTPSYATQYTQHTESSIVLSSNKSAQYAEVWTWTAELLKVFAFLFGAELLRLPWPDHYTEIPTAWD